MFLFLYSFNMLFVSAWCRYNLNPVICTFCTLYLYYCNDKCICLVTVHKFWPTKDRQVGVKLPYIRVNSGEDGKSNIYSYLIIQFILLQSFRSECKKQYLFHRVGVTVSANHLYTMCTLICINLLVNQCTERILFQLHSGWKIWCWCNNTIKIILWTVVINLFFYISLLDSHNLSLISYINFIVVMMSKQTYQNSIIRPNCTWKGKYLHQSGFIFGMIYSTTVWVQSRMS